MDKKHFEDVLDYGIFDSPSELDLSDLSFSQLPKAYKYFTKVKTQSGQILLFLSKFSSMRPSVGDIGFLNKEKIEDGKYPLSDGEWILQIEKGVLKNWLRLEKFRDKHKEINFQVETIFPYGTQNGNLVFVGNQTAPDGRYTTGRFGTFDVLNGKIVPTHESNTLEFSPSIGIRIFLFLGSLGLLLLPANVFSNFFEGEMDLVNFTFLGLAIYFVGWSCYGIYISLFYKIIFDGENLIMGSSFYQKTIKKKDIQGYAYFKKGEDGRTIVLVMNDEKKIVFDDSSWGKGFEKIKDKIISDYPKMPNLSKVKYYSLTNWYAAVIGGGFLFFMLLIILFSWLIYDL